MSDLKALEARLAAAEGPDRELDCWLAFCTGKGKGVALRDVWTSPSSNQKLWMVSHPAGGWFRPERYTSSIDAAVTLVPEGWVYTIIAERPEKIFAHATVCRFQTFENPSAGATAALAIALACIRARIAAEPLQAPSGASTPNPKAKE